MQRDSFGEARSHSFPQGSIEEFDKLMHSPETVLSRQETLRNMRVQAPESISYTDQVKQNFIDFWASK